MKRCSRPPGPPPEPRQLLLVVFFMAALVGVLFLIVLNASAWDAKFRIRTVPGVSTWTAHVTIDGDPTTIVVPLEAPSPTDDPTIIQSFARDIRSGARFTFRVQATEGPAAGKLSNAVVIDCPEVVASIDGANRCDANRDGQVSASDALAVLQAAVAGGTSRVCR